MHRRDFLKRSLVPAALAAFPASLAAQSGDGRSPRSQPEVPEIVDTNVHLFDWPWRRLKYGRTAALVAKLRKHRVREAWAGSFEALLHKQLDGVNRRLAEECRTRGEGLLVPFGSVNPVWPDWEEDLRRCHEVYGMPGLRLYPAYHGYTLDRPEFARLLDAAAQRGLLVQIAIRMEDERVHHPTLDAPVVSAAPLVDVLRKVPQARVQLINADTALRGGHVPALVEDTSATFDIAGIEANGGVGRLIEGTHPYYRTAVPVERLLFGSHAPFFPCESALLKLFESPLSREQLERLMHGNAGRVLKA